MLLHQKKNQKKNQKKIMLSFLLFWFFHIFLDQFPEMHSTKLSLQEEKQIFKTTEEEPEEAFSFLVPA